MPLPRVDTAVAIQGQNNNLKELIADEQRQLKEIDAIRGLQPDTAEQVCRTYAAFPTRV